MRRISLKTGLYAVFYTFTALVLCVCLVEPVDRTGFVQNEKVQEVIGKGQEKVNLTDDSEGTAGNEIITVDTASYYTVEEFEEFGDLTSISAQFVSGSGLRTKNTSEIARVSGGKITGLTNGNWYRVLKAKPFIGGVYYDNLTATTPPASITGTSGTLGDGKITIPAPAAGETYYMDVSNLMAGDQAPTASYDIVGVRVSPTGAGTSFTPVRTGYIIKLEGEGTQTDYVFAEKLADGNAFVTKFFFFTVVIEPKLPEAEITMNITITYSLANTKAIALELTNGGTPMTSPYTINQSAPPTIVIGLTPAAIALLSGTPTYNWYYDKGTLSVPTNGSSISVDFDSNPDYLLLGTNTFTVFIKDDDGFYTAEVMITVGGS
jgi:hypothetical protein